jgi:DNA-binding transcriptional ArsR family regulator
MSSGVEPHQVAGLRAMAHPLRLRLLSLLTGTAMSAAEVARELDLTHANASYHLRQLYAAGLLTVAEEESIRGGRAKRYRHDPAASQVTGSADPSGRRAIWSVVADELLRRASAQAVRPGLRQHMTDAELWVDPEVWADVVADILAASVKLHEAARPPRTPGTVQTSATIALFEMGPDAR